MIAFSDGIYDVSNEAGKKYGEMRFLRSFLKAHNNSESSAEVLEKVLQDLQKHRQQCELDDDISLICLDLPRHNLDHPGSY